MKFSSINTMEHVEALYGKNKEINRDIFCSWIDRLNIVKMTFPPKFICRFAPIPIKIPGIFFVDIESLP